MEKTVCVDLDATLARYEGWQGVEVIGPPLPGAREFMKELTSFSDVCVHTTRTNPNVNHGSDVVHLVDRIDIWLVQNGIPFDSIAGIGGKPIAAAYVDDRGVECRPQSEADAYVTALRKCKALVDDEPIGGTGQFPAGSIDPNDEGEIRLMVSTHENNVRVDFGKKVEWIAMSADEALEIADLLTKHAESL